MRNLIFWGILNQLLFLSSAFAQSPRELASINVDAVIAEAKTMKPQQAMTWLHTEYLWDLREASLDLDRESPEFAENSRIRKALTDYYRELRAKTVGHKARKQLKKNKNKKYHAPKRLSCKQLRRQYRRGKGVGADMW